MTINSGTHQQDSKTTCPVCDATVTESDMRVYRGHRMCVWCRDQEKRAERSRG